MFMCHLVPFAAFFPFISQVSLLRYIQLVSLLHIMDLVLLLAVVIVETALDLLNVSAALLFFLYLTPESSGLFSVTFQFCHF